MQEGTPNSAPTIVSTEAKRDIDAYLAGRKSGPRSLQDIITYNLANPVEGLKYQQGELLAQAVNLSDPATAAAYAANLASGKASSQAVIDNMLNNGTPSDPSDDFAAIVVPSGDPLVGIADRAGYLLVLTVPVSYGATASANGHNPVGVTFIGTAFSEAELLDDGYASRAGDEGERLAPSYTNSEHAAVRPRQHVLHRGASATRATSS